MAMSRHRIILTCSYISPIFNSTSRRNTLTGTKVLKTCSVNSHYLSGKLKPSSFNFSCKSFNHFPETRLFGASLLDLKKIIWTDIIKFIYILCYHQIVTTCTIEKVTDLLVQFSGYIKNDTAPMTLTNLNLTGGIHAIATHKPNIHLSRLDTCYDKYLALNIIERLDTEAL